MHCEGGLLLRRRDFDRPHPHPATCMYLYKTIRRGLEMVHLKQHRPLHTVPVTYRHHSKLRHPVNTPAGPDLPASVHNLHIIYI